MTVGVGFSSHHSLLDQMDRTKQLPVDVASRLGDVGSSKRDNVVSNSAGVQKGGEGLLVGTVAETMVEMGSFLGYSID